MTSPATNQSAQAERLKTIKLLNKFSDEQLAQLAPFFYESTYERESVIFYERDLPADSGSRIYFVLEGCVKLVKYSSDGESTIMRLASVGEFFGATSALTGNPYPFSAEVLNDSVVAYISRDDFERVVRQYPDISMEMMVALGEVLWFNYETHNQVVKKTDARVGKIILYHMQRDGFEETEEGKQLKIMLPHEYIASMTGIAYEESVRIVSRLKKNHNCIQYLRGGKIIVTDEAALREIAQVEDGCCP